MPDAAKDSDEPESEFGSVADTDVGAGTDESGRIV
jgi:hypothetical protein